MTTDRCVVFDLDGVLVMSEHLWEQGWQSVAADHGYAWLPDDTRTCQGKSVPEWARYLATAQAWTRRPQPTTSSAASRAPTTAARCH